jgi:hypothetical protein
MNVGLGLTKIGMINLVLKLYAKEGGKSEYESRNKVVVNVNDYPVYKIELIVYMCWFRAWRWFGMSV